MKRVDNDWADNQEYAGKLGVRVERAMRSGQWMTSTEIALAANEPVTNLNSVTAAYRALRKQGYTISRRRNEENPGMGKYQYRMETGSPFIEDNVKPERVIVKAEPVKGNFWDDPELLKNAASSLTKYYSTKSGRQFYS